MKTTLYQHPDGHSISYNPVTSILTCHDGLYGCTVNIHFFHDDLTVLGEGMAKIGHTANRHARAISRIKPLFDTVYCVMESHIYGFKDLTFEITYSHNVEEVFFVDELKDRKDRKNRVAYIPIAPAALITLGEVMIAVGSVLKGDAE